MYTAEGEEMIRTQVYLNEEQKRALEQLSLQERISLAELIRRAVDEFLEKAEQDSFARALEASFAMWQDRADLGEGQDYVRQLRREWEERGTG